MPGKCRQQDVKVFGINKIMYLRAHSVRLFWNLNRRTFESILTFLPLYLTHLSEITKKKQMRTIVGGGGVKFLCFVLYNITGWV